MIYLDNACTSYPKPRTVPETVYRFMTEGGVNINRSSYERAGAADEAVYDVRSALSDFFGGEGPQQVAFTANITTSLNMLLKGFLRPGDHVIVSSMEHNAVMRPLVQLQRRGVSFSRVPCREDGSLDPADLPALLQTNTRAVVMLHASNVCGTVLPLAAVGGFCAEKGLRFFVDSAQTAGIWPLDMRTMHIDALAFTGHKGLLGPQGIGGFILKKELVAEVEPLLSGGTGSLSHTEEQPSFMPDRYESGTANVAGILGLGAGLAYIRGQGRERLLSRELALTGRFLEGLAELEKDGLLRIVGKKDTKDRVGVVSLTTDRTDLAELTDRLDREYGIAVRTGLHCAPAAHKTLGTFPGGTVRFSVGAFSTEADTDAALAALRRILTE